MNEVNRPNQTELLRELLELETAVNAKEFAPLIRKYKLKGCRKKQASEKARTDFILNGDDHIKGIRTLYYDYIKYVPKGTVKLICELLTRLQPHKFKVTPDTFKARLSHIEKQGIENYLLKNNAGRKKKYNHDSLSALVEKWKRQSENLTFRQVTDFVLLDLKDSGIEADAKIRSTLKAIYYREGIKNRVIPAITGSWDAMLPPTRTYIPYPNHTWECDATTYDQYYKNRKAGKDFLDKLVIYTVRDAYSGKILGLSFGEVESTALQMRAIRHAVMCSGYKLPKYFVFDNALRGAGKKGNRRKKGESDEFGEFMERLVPLGGNAKRGRPGRPTDKARIEGGFGHTQQHFLNKIPGFMRAGITAKNRLDKMWVKAYLKNIWEPHTIKTAAVISLMDEYNNAISDGDQMSPNMRYAHDAPSSIQLRPEEFAFLFWNSKKEGITVRKSEVEFTYKHERTYFIVDLNQVDWAKVNYKRFRVRFDIDEHGRLIKDKIYLFTLDEDEFVCSATYNMKINHDDELRSDAEQNAWHNKNEMRKRVRKQEEQRKAEQEKRIVTDYGELAAVIPANLLGLTKVDEKNADLLLYRELLGISDDDIARAQGKEAKVIPIEHEPGNKLQKAEVIKRTTDRWDSVSDEDEPIKKETMVVGTPAISEDDSDNWR
jgi:hypothetical protein